MVQAVYNPSPAAYFKPRFTPAAQLKVADTAHLTLLRTKILDLL
jgi:hypothetical protein